MKIRIGLSAVMLVVLLGCGSGGSGGGENNISENNNGREESTGNSDPPPGTSTPILYALDQRGGNVVVYGLDENGDLREQSVTPTEFVNPAGVILNPQETILYTAYIGSFDGAGYTPNNVVSQYRINTSGNLSKGTSFTLGSQGRGPGPTVFTSDGKFAYIADPNANKIYSFSMDGEGIWSPINEISTPSMPIDIAIHPGNKFLYAANMGADSLQLYQIEINGALTLLGTTAQVSNQMDIEFTAEGAHAYITTSVGDIVITDVNTNTGTFSSSQRLMIEENGLGGMTVNVAKKFAYTLNCPLKQVTAYKIQASADLLKVGKLILDECPITITLDENKNTAYLATLNRSEIIVLGIGGDGNLTQKEVIFTNYVPRGLLVIKK